MTTNHLDNSNTVVNIRNKTQDMNHNIDNNENDEKNDYSPNSSTHSMDVSSSISPQFMSPPTVNKNKNERTRTPAQKRRDRRYNLKKFRSKMKHNNKTKQQTTLNQSQQPIHVFPNIERKPIIAVNVPSTTSSTNSDRKIQENNTIQQKQDHKNNTATKNDDNTLRVVDFITESQCNLVNNNDVKGILVFSEPSEESLPTHTLNYVSIDFNLFQNTNMNMYDDQTGLQNYKLNMKDSVLHINKILFRFTEYGTGKKWYYCHYIDLDYHGNIILLDERDTPQNLIHQFVIQHNIGQSHPQQCKQCTQQHNQEQQPIGYYTPCYIHKYKHNRTHYDKEDYVDLIKHIQKTCQRENRKQKRLVHNPVIFTQHIDKQRKLACSTILPTNRNHKYTIAQALFESSDTKDTIFGVNTTSMVLPMSVSCHVCSSEHIQTISYEIYQEEFICDRCGYGQNPLDLIYRCKNVDNQKEQQCNEIDICCKCAIHIMNTRDQDDDFYTQQMMEQKQNCEKKIYDVNVPMVNTRFIHPIQRLKRDLLFHPSINYVFQSEPQVSQTGQDNLNDIIEHKEEKRELTDLVTDEHTTMITTHTLNVELTETDDEEDNSLLVSASNVLNNETNHTQQVSHHTTIIEQKETEKEQTHKQQQVSSQTNIEPNNTTVSQDDRDTDSEAAPLMIPTRASYLHTLSHTPPAQQQPANPLDMTEPPFKRRRAPQTTKPQTNNGVQDCTQCHTQYNKSDLWRCKNKFKCNKCLCLNCLVQNGYNKYYMMNCKQIWYCNQCLDENTQVRYEHEQRRRKQHQHLHKKKKYGIPKFQNAIECNLGVKCSKPLATYVTQRNFQKHCLENGWYYHKNLQIWKYWKVKPCLYCLNKFTTHQNSKQYRQRSTNTFTSADVAWIPLNQNNNLCQRCDAEIKNDPSKTIETLETENQWSTPIIDVTTISNLSDGDTGINYVSQILQKDSIRQVDGVQDVMLPSILEVDSISVQQVEKIPVAMIGRTKIIINKILYNINNVSYLNIDEQELLIKQLIMVWKIITQERVRSYSTYKGYIARSDMEYKLQLLEAGKWREAWDNLLVNKILRHVNRPAVLSNFNTIMNNIRTKQGQFNDECVDDQSYERLDQKQNDSDDEEKADIMVIETPQDPTTPATNNVVHTMHERNPQTQSTCAYVPPMHDPRQDRFNQTKAQFLASQGKYKKAILALESKGLCPNTIEYRQIFASKLEQANGIINKPRVMVDQETEFQFQYNQIQHVVQWMDHTSGPGSDGMKIRYLKQMMYNINDIPELINNITIFLNNMANGTLPPYIAQHMRHSRAISGMKLKKDYIDTNRKIIYDNQKDRYVEGEYLIKKDVRPITIQSGWIRLCNKLIFGKNKVLTNKLCLEKQIGIGCPSGAQALIAAAKIGIDLIKQQPTKAMMKLDFNNCYNTIDRQKVLNVMAELAPELTGIFYQRYRSIYVVTY